MIMDYRQQGQGQFFPGSPGGAGGINNRLDRLERQIERLDRRIDQQDRRLDRIERRLGLRQDTEYTEYYY
jgi:hypothetical protein